MIEKHFILDKKIGGPDVNFSLDKDEFKQMVNAVRNTEKALGKTDYELSEKAIANRMFTRSLYIVKDIKKGEKFTEENIRSIRPGYGLHPKYLPEILGKQANRNLKKGTRMKWEFIL